MVEFSPRVFREGLPVGRQSSGRIRRIQRPAVPPFWPVLAFLAADLTALLGAFVICCGGAALFAGDGLTFLPQRHHLPLAGLAIGIFALAGLYRLRLSETEEVRRVVLGAAFLVLASLVLHLVPGPWQVPAWTSAVWPVFAGFALVMRVLLRDMAPLRRAMAVPVILLGSGSAAASFRQRLEENPSWPVTLLRSAAMPELAGRGPSDVAAVIAREARRAGVAPGAVEIVLMPAPGERVAAAALASRLDGLGQPFVLPMDLPPGQAVPWLAMPPASQTSGGMGGPIGSRPARIVKRVFDILIAGSLILLLSPFFLIVVALIRLDGGPALFGQMRVGRGGRRFRCLKFRSMCVDAQARLAAILADDPKARAEWEKHQKLRRDPRITRIGRFLRETSLDELPQLLNVLRGEMSLVGPRPIMAPEVPGYAGDHAYYHGPSFPLYAACIPGITGLWQVSGRANTTHDERIRLDGWYTRNWSFWLDIAILLRTVRVILNRSGQ